MTSILDHTITGLLEDILNAGSHLRVRVTGRSMAPFLNGGEAVTLKKVSFTSLRRGDLIFFKNSHADLLLHRIVHKRQSFDGTITFLTKGDALRFLDEPVPGRKVLGKVVKIEKTNFTDEMKCLYMESKPWRVINPIIAVIGIVKAGFFNVLGELKGGCPPLKNISMKIAPQDK